jgi:hypothetical protein
MNLSTLIERIRHAAAGLYMALQLNAPAWKRTLFVAFFVVLGSSVNSFAADRASHQPCPRYLLPPPVLEKPFFFAGEPIPIHRADVRARVVDQLNFLLLDARGVLTEWLSEKARYSWIFEEILAKEGVPKEFILFSPVIYGLTRNTARTAPVGWWALDKPCESSEGIELSDDAWHDDRLDYELATRCFAARIKRMRSELADTGWLLTAAAYVTSTKTIQELMQRWNARSYWDLPLPDNAEELVVRWIAFSIISAHREAYGLRFKETPPLMFDQITALIFTKDLPVAQIAGMAGVSAREILEMNPKIKPASGLFPAKDRGRSVTHTIAVPKGKGWAVVNKLREDGYLASVDKPQ